MRCVKCGGDVHDNRAKKAAGEYKPNAPDFVCVNKDGCGWKSWPSKGKATPPLPPVAVQAPIAPPSAPQAHSGPSGNGSRDAQLVELYWRCFDEVLQGLKTRSMASGFPGSEIAACVATMFIARSKIL